MFSFGLVYFASHPGAQVRLKIFRFSYSFARGAALWRFKEITGR
jgi:hypothetical protein